ncbi:hypothetical protein BDK51DRAFT_40499 [Blyttiomyces helicus]|uniref:Uncharacterized protein n=1 Tax=Blyttiomyces helicus TaxID=388810 RepID=A0A4P9VVK7_9FUNG|nr:hypothetical protein BDK51DRAFT_40499 [Blyttiomyces helicus]|eukprot:RKO83162.1 hypothetical protein BDK51DRAFT_40499 [Blyttiomyces helicus]
MVLNPTLSALIDAAPGWSMLDIGCAYAVTVRVGPLHSPISRITQVGRYFQLPIRATSSRSFSAPSTVSTEAVSTFFRGGILCDDRAGGKGSVDALTCSNAPREPLPRHEMRRSNVTASPVLASFTFTTAPQAAVVHRLRCMHGGWRDGRPLGWIRHVQYTSLDIAGSCILPAVLDGAHRGHSTSPPPCFDHFRVLALLHWNGGHRRSLL